jgi:hypothetical protein
VLFVLVGAMMIFLVSMLTEQVYARIEGHAILEHFNVPINAHFTHIRGHLDAGEWIFKPITRNDVEIFWETEASPAPGNEKGEIDAIVALSQPSQPIGVVTLLWTRTFDGHTTCGFRSQWQIEHVECSISPGRDRDSSQIRYVVKVKNCRTCGPATGTGTGTDRNDNFVGTSNEDFFDGKGGNDNANGMAGNDKLNGGEGKDILLGGDGNDELTGGPGPDTFQCGSGTDKITDFKPSEGDKKTSDCEQF